MPILYNGGSGGGGGVGTVTNVSSADANISVATPTTTPVLTAVSTPAITETSGPTKLVAGTIADGQFLKRVGATLVSSGEAVTSVFTRTGAVVAAASDYTLAQIAAGTNHTLALSGSSVMGSLGAGTAVQSLVSGGSGADPSWVGWSATYDLVNNSTLQNLISQSIPGNTLGTNGALLVELAGFYFNNTGASKGVTLEVTFGGTTLWGDASASTFLITSTTARAFFMRFVLANEGATNAQRLGGTVSIGVNNSGSVAGNGQLGSGADLTSVSFHGSSAVDTTAAKTLQVQAQHSSASASLELKGTAHIQVVA